MDDIKKRREIVAKTLRALAKRMKTPINENDLDAYEMRRESLIQRFEYTIDTFWKFIKLYLEHVQKIELEIASPRGILRAAAEAKIISPDELNQLLIATTDRNISSHGYEEDVAEEVASRIPDHYAVLEAIFKRLLIE
jgi:nucleotidyltransferase substrate binding protein (TIGR01987 family)